MKTFSEFIKENNYIQEKLDATVYGEVKYGASASKPKSKSEISNMVSTAVDDVKAGKPVKPAGKSSASKRKLSFGGSVSLNYEKKSGGGKTPPPTKVRPDKTTDPKTPTGGRTSTQSSSNDRRPNLVSSSSPSSSSTQSPSRIRNPKTAAISKMRMGTM